jgi:hypothetical protein
MLSTCHVILDEAGRVCGKPIVGDRTICNKCQALFDKLDEFDKFPT